MQKNLFQPNSGPDFDLNQITAFNPAIIYGFEPEEVFPSSLYSLLDYFIHAWKQYDDVFKAYLYAQETVLPAIREKGVSNITEEDILNWIDQIHVRIAHTLAHCYSMLGIEFVAGEPTKKQVLRFIHSVSLREKICLHLSNPKKYKRAEVLKLLVEEGFNEQLASRYLQLLSKIRNNKAIEISESEKPYINKSSQEVREGELAYAKLVTLYHNNKLTQEEKLLIEQFLTICAKPEDFPQMRQEFAKSLLVQWQACDPRDIDSVVELAYFAFYGITEGHWFSNGNGRTATCFMNILLVALGRSSILMRNPNERNDPLSSYSMAIKKINTEPQQLKNHIKIRIEEIENQQNYKDLKEAKLITYRVKLAELFITLQVQFGGCNINMCYEHVAQIVAQKISQDTSDQEDLILLSGISNFFTNLLNELICRKKEGFNSPEQVNYFTSTYLLEFMKNSQISQKNETEEKIVRSAPTPVQRKYSQTEIKDVLDDLKRLTKIESGWKAYTTKGLQILLNLEDSFPLEKQKELAKALNETQALKATPKALQSNGKPVILLEFIDSVSLKGVSALENWVLPLTESIEPQNKI